MEHGEPISTVLNGFTIQNGHSTPHSTTVENNGISLYQASPTITNNIITNNTGCGINVANQSAPLIQGNDIARNIVAQDGAFTQCIGFNEVSSGGFGGTAIGMIGTGDVSIIGNTIEENSSLINSTFVGSEPGAISDTVTNGHTVLIQSNTLRNNLAQAFVDFITSPNLVEKVILDQNFISNTGFLRFGGSLIETNNTIVNSSQETGMLSGQIENNLFVYYGNRNSGGAGPLTCTLQKPSLNLSIKNNDVFPSIGFDLNYPPCSLGAGNISTDPLFLNSNAGDFHTQRSSPVVATGDINAPLIQPTDFDGKNRTVCGTIDMGAYEVHPIPPITLASSPNPSVGGSNVAFTAHVTGNCNMPTGTLTFLDGATVLATGVLDAGGNTMFSTSTLTVGTHSITATYPGDFNFDPSTSPPYSQVVTGYPTAVALQVAPNPARAFQTLSLSALVSSAFGVPTGTVSFMAAGKVLGTAAVGGNGQAATSISTLGAGTYSITAMYNASLLYASSTSSAVLEVVNGAPTGTVLASAPNPSTFGQSVSLTATVAAPQTSSIPTGSVSFQEGSLILGSMPLSANGAATFATNALAVGSHTIVAVYSGSGNNNTSTSNPVVQVVGLAPDVLALTGTPNPANTGETVILSATVLPTTGNLVIPSGTVSFADQSGLLGAAPLNGGRAVLTTSTLAAGSHTITATYSNGGNFAPGTSPSFVEVIQPHDFRISLSPANITISSGETGQATVQLTSIGSYAGTLNLGKGQIPTYGALAFAPGLVSLGSGGTAPSTISIKTVHLPPPYASLHGATSKNVRSVVWAVLLFSPLTMFKRKRLSKLLICLFGAILMGISTGCTNVSFVPLRVAPGTYVIPITATDPMTGITHTANLTVTITS
jgi:parallel beta-helix repeat protein